MYLTRHGQIRSLKKKEENEVEVSPLVSPGEKHLPLRRICRCPTTVKDSGEDIRRNDDSGQPETPGQTTRKSNRGQASGYIKKLEESHPRFGPVHAVDQPSVDATKEKAWEHVLKSVSKTVKLGIKEAAIKEAEIKEAYLTAMRKVETEAMECYAENVPSIGSSFRWMMIKDGCFFLQLALLILGCSKQLGYPDNDPIFGRKNSKKDIKKLIESIFFVGNQIPYVVLKELMAQKFFQDIIAEVKWDPTPSSLCRKALYELLVFPALGRTSSSNQWLSLKQRILGGGGGNALVDQLQPCDLLHGLQILVLGPDDRGHLSSAYDPQDDDFDLEANEEDIEEYGRRDDPAATDDDEGDLPDDFGSRVRIFLKAIGVRSSALEERRRIFPCATELNRAGIHIKKLKNGGVRGILFKNYYFRAYLYLPVFPVDENTEIIFESLKSYEISQQLGKHRREVRSYLRVMSDIVRTRKDVKLLEKKGIILLGNSNEAEKFPGILSRLTAEDVALTYEFRNLRRQIRDYSSPWIHYKGILNVVVFLTLLQSFFAVLAYFRPPKQ